MKARQIPFSGEMVLALLDGRKTQTRRTVKPQPEYRGDGLYYEWRRVPDGFVRRGCNEGGLVDLLLDRCPYGVPGDLLWVREAWQAWTEFDHLPPRDIPSTSRVNYLAHGNVWDARKRHARFMPRWASRLTLRLTDVRVQRVQEISEADAKAEGAMAVPMQVAPDYPYVRFRNLWNSIHGPGAWSANPWVWVLDFDIHHCNVDEFLQKEAA